jgi:hypothetical protein
MNYILAPISNTQFLFSFFGQFSYFVNEPEINMLRRMAIQDCTIAEHNVIYFYISKLESF